MRGYAAATFVASCTDFRVTTPFDVQGPGSLRLTGTPSLN